MYPKRILGKFPTILTVNTIFCFDVKVENDMEHGYTNEDNQNSENQSFQESSLGDGDEDSLRLIAEGIESQYNYNPNGTNTAYTVFLIVNAALGAGLLNFPKSYDVVNYYKKCPNQYM